MGIIRLAVFGFIFLGIVYLVISIYSRSVRREKLEDKWDEDIKEGDRDAYIKAGMQDYETSLRKKLMLLVFVVPVIVIATAFYLVN